MSTADVGRLLLIAPRTVCLWAECSELPGIKVGRQWRFRRADIDRWINDTRLHPGHRSRACKLGAEIKVRREKARADSGSGDF
jgi:excisionase family DNA binding protein